MYQINRLIQIESSLKLLIVVNAKLLIPNIKLKLMFDIYLIINDLQSSSTTYWPFNLSFRIRTPGNSKSLFLCIYSSILLFLFLFNIFPYLLPRVIPLLSFYLILVFIIILPFFVHLILFLFYYLFFFFFYRVLFLLNSFLFQKILFLLFDLFNWLFSTFPCLII